MDILNLNSFLQMGYFIDYKSSNYTLDLSGIDKQKYKNFSETELIEIGTEKFLNGIANEFDANKKNVLPLSGGLDSRAILAGLLKFSEAGQICTFTFGTPGTLDYEIGNYLASVAGTNHKSFPLPECRYSQKDFLEVSYQTDHQTVLFHHPPISELKNYYLDSTIWSGYVGDVVAGGYLPYKKETIEKARSNHFNYFSFCKSIDLTCCAPSDYWKRVDTSNYLDPKVLSYEEQLLFNERSVKMTAPHILFNNFNYKTPFINNEFMDFLFSIEDEFRRDKYLYKKILQNLSPELFGLKTKNNFGLPIGVKGMRQFSYRALNKLKQIISRFIPFVVAPGINYMDFESAIRNNSNFRQIIQSNIYDLMDRKTVDWIDIEKIWKDHLGKKRNHADALLILSSLELHLKSKAEYRG